MSRDCSLAISTTIERIENLTLKTTRTLQTSLPALHQQVQHGLQQVAWQHSDASLAHGETHRKLDEILSLMQSETELTMTRTDARHKQDGQAVALLASKPALLRDVCDRAVVLAGTGVTNNPPATSISERQGDFRICFCPKYETHQSQRYSLGPVQYYKSSRIFRHIAGCPLASSQGVAQTWTRGLVLTSASMKYIRRAVEVTFSTSNGAGGYSISPCLTVHHIVDASESPAFRIIDSLYTTVLQWSDMELDNVAFRTMAGGNADHTDSWSRLVQHVLDSIIKVYKSGKSSPYDIDEKHTTILHEIGGLVSLEPPEEFWGWPDGCADL